MPMSISSLIGSDIEKYHGLIKRPPSTESLPERLLVKSPPPQSKQWQTAPPVLISGSCHEIGNSQTNTTSPLDSTIAPAASLLAMAGLVNDILPARIKKLQSYGQLLNFETNGLHDKDSGIENEEHNIEVELSAKNSHRLESAAMAIPPCTEPIVSSSEVYDAIVDFPRLFLGTISYHLKKHSDVPLIPRMDGRENCIVNVLIPRRYLNPLENHSVIRRKVWGTDIYTDDSDIVAALIHSGKLGITIDPQELYNKQKELREARKARVKRARLYPDESPTEESDDTSSDKDSDDKDKSDFESTLRETTTRSCCEAPVTLSMVNPGPEKSLKRQLHTEQCAYLRRRRMKVKNEGDCLVKLLILPCLEKYHGTYRNGLNSRSWLCKHDGASFSIHSVKFIPRGDAEIMAEIKMQKMNGRNGALNWTAWDEPEDIEYVSDVSSIDSSSCCCFEERTSPGGHD